MNILAIETSTKACSAALWKDGEIFERFELAPQKHANLILPMVDEVLKKADVTKPEIDVLAFGEGPGAFTGIRIAAGVIQGLALGLQKPVVAVSSLEALIWLAHLETKSMQAIAFLDARMKEVYVQSGQVIEGKLQSEKASLMPVADALKMQLGDDALGVGDIMAEYPELASRFQRWESAYPAASAIAEIASQRTEQAVPIDEEIPLPVYLRNNVADKPKQV
jgi:tRNA threonylcarbamoyladenosine biosynthesis protein TsaB